MNKLGWILFVGAVVGGIWMLRKHRQSMGAIAPTQCVFHMDRKWSKSFQNTLQKSIQSWYEGSKNPDQVIEQTITDFPLVDVVHAQICSADKICFSIDGLKPVFVINDQSVVSSTGVVSDKSVFSDELCTQLPHVTAQSMDQLQSMIPFFETLDPAVWQNYQITWHCKDTIACVSKQYPSMRCILSVYDVPTAKTMQTCVDLYQDHCAKVSKKKNKQQGMEYDVRFRNQIIVRAGG